MPYINEVLAANERKNTEAKHLPSSGHPSRFRFDPEAVADLLKARIIGQPELHTAVSDMLHVVRADFGSGGKPLAVFLLLGPTGVGKTETVRILAEAILGNATELCRIDMNTLSQEHYTAAITGAPPGYVGSKENHSLFQFEKVEGSYGKPGLVLFDEIEKASAQVARALMNILDSGVLELSSGNKQLSFANAIIFMTSNEGARELEHYRMSFEHGWRKWLGRKPSHAKEKLILEEALRSRFDPEFINRIDRTVRFDSLKKEALGSILDVEISMLEKRLLKYGISISLDEETSAFLMRDYDARYGARHLRRRIRQYLEPVIAKVINHDSDQLLLHIGYKNGEIYLKSG
ncbi:MAG: AAA family ATPase [Akkermansiaceae bacterium]